MTNETTIEVGDIQIRVYRAVGREDCLVVMVNDTSKCLARVTVRAGSVENVVTMPKDDEKIVSMRPRS